MAGSIQNINAVAIKLKLHGGGRNGNTALLFNIHPVGGGVLIAFAGLHAAGGANRATVKQEFFRQGCLTGVRVRNDGEGSPFFHLIMQHGGKFRRLNCGQHGTPPKVHLSFTQALILHRKTQYCQEIYRGNCVGISPAKTSPSRLAFPRPFPYNDLDSCKGGCSACEYC